MQKLASALDPASHYDEEYAGLKNRHGELRARCSALWQGARLTSPEDAPGGPAVREPIAGAAELQSGMGALVASMSKAHSALEPVPLLAERIRAEVNEAAETAYDLTSTRRHLHAFFRRRRDRLRMTTSMIASRMKRHVTDWVTAQYVAPHLHERLRLLEAEIEISEGRLRRLRPEACHAEDGGRRDLPVGKASSGEPLFRGSGPYSRGTLDPVFQADVVVCLRELVFEDRATRTLRRFVRRMQHVPLSHRRQLWEIAEKLQAAAGKTPRGSTRASPVPLKKVAMSESLEARVRELAKEVGCPGLLRTDGGLAFARAVLVALPALLERQRLRMAFPAYESAAPHGTAGRREAAGVATTDGHGAVEDGGASTPESSDGRVTFLKRDAWLPFAIVQPKVDLAVAEQRVLMRGSASADARQGRRRRACRSRQELPPSEQVGLDSELLQELELLRSGGEAEVERRLSDLAAERGAPPSGGGGPSEEQALAPDHLLRTYYILRHVHTRDLRHRLLGLLNAFRLAQQRIAHGALSMQRLSDESLAAGVTGATASPSQDLGGGAPHAGLGLRPPTLASGACARPGDLGATCADALGTMSDLERAVMAEGGELSVEDGHGVRIMHESALPDLRACEDEMAGIGSHVVHAAPPALQGQIDRAGILADLFAAEVLYHQAKWRLLEPYLEAYEHTADPDARRDIGQRAADVMAERPRFNLQAAYFAEAYALATAAAESRARLLHEVVWHQVRLEASIAQGLESRQDVLRQFQARTPKAAAAGTEEDPQLSTSEGLAHAGEGLPLPQGASGLPLRLVPTAPPPWSEPADLLDFAGSLGLAWQVDLLVEDAVGSLAEDVAPEAWRRHGLEGACASVVLDEWRREVSRESGGLPAAAPGPQVTPRVSVAASAAGAAMGDGLGHEAIDDPAWLMLQVEDTLATIDFDAQSEQIASRMSRQFVYTPVYDMSSSRSSKEYAGGGRPSTGSGFLRGRGSPASTDNFLIKATSAKSAASVFRKKVDEAGPMLLTQEELHLELEEVPRDEQALTLYCNLLEHARVRRLLADTAHEVQGLEQALACQAEMVKMTSATVRAEPIPELVKLAGILGKELGGNDSPDSVMVVKKPVLLSACEVDAAFAGEDLATGRGVVAACLPSRLRELRLMLQNELANRWLCAVCLAYNSAALGAACRGTPSASEPRTPAAAPVSEPDADRQLRRASRLVRGLRRTGALSPLPPELEEEEPGGPGERDAASPAAGTPLKSLAGALQFPAALKGPIWLSVAGSLRDRLKRARVHMLGMSNEAEQERCMAQMRQRFLAYCSHFMAEKARDLAVRVQAAKAARELRTTVAMIPPELSPFVLSKDDDPREMVSADGFVKSLFHLPRVADVLALRGASKGGLDIAGSIHRLERALPEFLDEAEGDRITGPRRKITTPRAGGNSPSRTAKGQLLRTTCLSGSVGFDGSGSATLRLDEIEYSGPAYYVLRLMYELGQVVAFSFFSNSIAGDGPLLLRLHHMAARHDESAARNAAASVLDASLLGPVHSDDEFEREKTAKTAEQRTWDGLESIRTDFMRLASQVASLKGARGEFQSLLGLLRQRAQCDVLRAGLVLQQALAAAVEEDDPEQAGEIQRWLLHLEGYCAEGGHAVVVPGASARAGLVAEGESEVGALERLTILTPGGGPSRFCQLGDDRDQEALVQQAARAPPPCLHIHPSAWGLAALFRGAARRPSSGSNRELIGSTGRAPWAVPGLPLLGATRALCLLRGPGRDRAAKLQSCLEMRADEYLRLKGVDADHAGSLEIEQEFCQTQLALLHLRSAALCFQLRLPPPRTAAEQRHFDAVFAERFATRAESAAAAATRNDPNVNLLREEMSDAFEVMGRLVASINTSVMKCGVGALARTVRTMEAAAQGPGCQAVRAFAQHLRERGTHTEIFGEGEGPAFIVKEKDLDESVEEMGRRALKWACDAGERQLASARERVARSSEGLVQAEQALQQALLELSHVDDERTARVAAMVGEQSQRQLHEVDHLRRCLEQLAAASFELEHRMSSEIRSAVLNELGKLDAAVLAAQSVPGQYRTAVLDAVLEESAELQRNVLRQLGENEKLPRTLQLKAKVALEERQRAAPPEIEPASGGAPAASASVHQDAVYPIEALHEDIQILERAAARVRTKHQLEFQSLRQACEDEVRGVASNLSSNAGQWEQVARARERAQLIGEELALAHKQGQAATAAVESLDSHVESMAKDRDRLSRWWEGKSRAQVKLEGDLARCDGRGVDLHKLQARSADASREADRLILGLATEEECIAVQEDTSAQRRRWLLCQARREEQMAAKGAAKAQLLRTELELGHEDDADSLVALMHSQWQEIMRDIADLEAENLLLREGRPDGRGSPGAPSPGTSPGLPELLDPDAQVHSLEERLCFSMGALGPLSARAVLQGGSRIDQVRAAGAFADLLRPPALEAPPAPSRAQSWGPAAPEAIRREPAASGGSRPRSPEAAGAFRASGGDSPRRGGARFSAARLSAAQRLSSAACSSGHGSIAKTPRLGSTISAGPSPPPSGLTEESLAARRSPGSPRLVERRAAVRMEISEHHSLTAKLKIQELKDQLKQTAPLHRTAMARRTIAALSAGSATLPSSGSAAAAARSSSRTSGGSAARVAPSGPSRPSSTLRTSPGPTARDEELSGTTSALRTTTSRLNAARGTTAAARRQT